MGGLVPSQQILELYNLDDDPEERDNVAKERFDVVLRLKNIALNYYRQVLVSWSGSWDKECLFQIHDTSQVHGASDNQSGIHRSSAIPAWNTDRDDWMVKGGMPIYSCKEFTQLHNWNDDECRRILLKNCVMYKAAKNIQNSEPSNWYFSSMKPWELITTGIRLHK